jgi:hypothetical protein
MQLETDTEDTIIELDDKAPFLETEPLRDKLSKIEPEVEQENKKPADTSDEDSDSEDLNEYGDRVRKRISKEVWKRREAERKNKELEDRLNEVMGSYKETHTNLIRSNEAALSAREESIKSEFEKIQTTYKNSYDSGDTDEMFRATDRLTDLKAELRDIEGFKGRLKREAAVEEPVHRPRSNGPDERAVDWASRNEWFGKDVAKTGAAYAIDASLKSEGFDPSSDDYYEELNSRLYKEFPSLAKKEAPKAGVKSSSQQVAGVSRGSTSRQIKLSPSQVQMANKLGVPLAEYARYLK